MNSEPLSVTMTLGSPRSSRRRSSTAMTPTAGIERATWMARHSRLNSSMMFWHRKRRLELSVSDIKSIDQRSLRPERAARTGRGA